LDLRVVTGIGRKGSTSISLDEIVLRYLPAAVDVNGYMMLLAY